MHEVMAKGILSAENGMNIYRGCQHGCIYCDSRSHCYQMDHDFEDIEVKKNAPELLEEALCRKRKKVMIGTGAMTDPYIPLEMQTGNMRKCLEIIERYECGVTVLTKSNRILRDLDLLQKINQKAKCVVAMTLTTYDEKLCKLIEPNVCTTGERFEVLKIMRDHGIPTVVWMTPTLPFINDTEENLRGLLKLCVEAEVYGIICFGFGLTLREGNREYFYEQLDRKFPGMKQRYIQTFGNAYAVNSPHHAEFMRILRQTGKEHGMETNPDKVFEYMRRYENHNYEQLCLPF